MARTARPILLAKAIATSICGFRAAIRSNHDPAGIALRPSHFSVTSRRRLAASDYPTARPRTFGQAPPSLKKIIDVGPIRAIQQSHVRIGRFHRPCKRLDRQGVQWTDSWNRLQAARRFGVCCEFLYPLLFAHRHPPSSQQSAPKDPHFILPLLFPAGN
jgi:hypothetical protein